MVRRWLVVLDTMWGAGGMAPHWFHINPRNRSGARLYALTGAKFGEILVTNACPQQTRHPDLHGRPDAAWLARSLETIPEKFLGAPLLVCGNVAQNTYERIEYEHYGRVFLLPHPAARMWSHDLMAEWKAKLATIPRRRK